MKTGIELIAQERNEQIEKHKWDDRDYVYEELIDAAEFSLHPHRRDQKWPFRDKTFADKISRKTKIEQLAVAGAFIAAEIDRLQADLTNN